MRSRIRFSLASIASAAVLAFAPEAPADLVFAGTSWDGTVKIEVRASKAGHAEFEFPGTMVFTPSGFELLNSVTLLAGTYSVLKDGKADLVPGSTESFVTGLLEFSGWTVQALEIVDARMRAELTARKNGIWLKSKAKIKALATIGNLPVGSVESKVKVTLEFNWLNPADISET